MEKVFIIHGYDGSPNRAWRPWLMRELAKENIYACALPMPGGRTPSCDVWIETITRAVGDSQQIYLVGHSLGARAVLRYLETLKDVEIEGVVLVSPRFGKPKSEALVSFYDELLDFDKLKKSSKHFVVIHGDNDPFIPYEDGKQMAQSLDCEFITIPGGGHLSGKANWNELPEARDALLRMMNK